MSFQSLAFFGFLAAALAVCLTAGRRSPRAGAAMLAAASAVFCLLGPGGWTVVLGGVACLLAGICVTAWAIRRMARSGGRRRTMVLACVYHIAILVGFKYTEFLTGGAVEVLLLIDRGEKTWECLVRPGKRMRTGAKLSFGDGELTAEVVEELPGGNRLVRFDYEGIFLEVLERLGKMPLPPYIKEELQDQERYQTVYSKVNGSAAAPTAGLHFTQELLDQVSAMGVKLGYVTLHVGLGTFRPVKEDEIEGHEMHSEYCVIPQETADLINETKKNGGRVICVGTTSCRTIESWAAEDGTMTASAGWTDIFIYPGYRFKVLDGLITNFHLPESTLIMLVSALAGREHVLAAYQEAVKERYHFFSFGDAMLIL